MAPTNHKIFRSPWPAVKDGDACELLLSDCNMRDVNARIPKLTSANELFADDRRYAQSHAEKIRKAQQKAAPWCAKLKKLEKYRACLAEARAYGWSHDVQKYTKKINKYQEQMKDELDAYSDFDVDIQRKLTTALHGHYNTRSLEFLEVLWPETTTYLPCPKVSENLKEQKISEHQEPEFEDVDFSAEAIRKRREEHLADWDMRYQ